MNSETNSTPDRSRTKVQLLLAARGGRRAELGVALRSLAEDMVLEVSSDVELRILTQIDEDPFPGANPLCRPVDAALELVGPAATFGADHAADVLDAVPPVLEGEVHLDLSGVVVGWPQAIIPGPNASLRYLYLMRRRADLDRAAYLSHYFHRHAGFARELGGITAYTQLHVDPAPSRDLARRLGVGMHAIDSVTELSFESLETFFAGLPPGGTEAGTDELGFVDRDNSVSFCSFDDPATTPATRPEPGDARPR